MKRTIQVLLILLPALASARVTIMGAPEQKKCEGKTTLDRLNAGLNQRRQYVTGACRHLIQSAASCCFDPPSCGIEQKIKEVKTGKTAKEGALNQANYSLQLKTFHNKAAKKCTEGRLGTQRICTKEIKAISVKIYDYKQVRGLEQRVQTEEAKKKATEDMANFFQRESETMRQCHADAEKAHGEAAKNALALANSISDDSDKDRYHAICSQETGDCRVQKSAQFDVNPSNDGNAVLLNSGNYRASGALISKDGKNAEYITTAKHFGEKVGQEVTADIPGVGKVHGVIESIDPNRDAAIVKLDHPVPLPNTDTKFAYIDPDLSSGCNTSGNLMACSPSGYEQLISNSKEIYASGFPGNHGTDLIQTRGTANYDSGGWFPWSEYDSVGSGTYIRPGHSGGPSWVVDAEGNRVIIGNNTSAYYYKEWQDLNGGTAYYDYSRSTPFYKSVLPPVLRLNATQLISGSEFMNDPSWGVP